MASDLVVGEEAEPEEGGQQNLEIPFILMKGLEDSLGGTVEKFLLSNFYGPILRFLVTFYSLYEVKCDQIAEYGTIKSLIVRISQL